MSQPTDKTSTVQLSKSFILLAGISGTGKTRFVREQALAFDSEKNNYCLVSVRPDWHEPSDLLGYVSRLSGKPEYVTTKVLDFIIRAWKVIAPNADARGTGELDLSAVPYWLCLDEMNLAPVEQYFADYLSVLETRNFKNGEYSCEALLDKNLLEDLDTNSENGLQKTFGLEEDPELWQYFLNFGITLPPNLIVAGTVNMDETTHGFSRKVIDRALTIDFGEFFPNDYSSFYEPESKVKTFTYSMLTQSSVEDLSSTIDSDGRKSITFLETVNDVLRRTPFELAYRALNELLLQVACSKPQTDAQLQAVWDDFLMSKILPRFDGDEDKLRHVNDDSVDNLLESLSVLLEAQLNEIWEARRLDFYREKIDGSVIDDIDCRSKAKLKWMKNRLEINTFTSYWP
ncbi:MAG: restriction endonuclease [Gammaproteobacteria bacterium]|nr:restriction endonuclease [Gammaproteobacteria bacterium]